MQRDAIINREAEMFFYLRHDSRTNLTTQNQVAQHSTLT